MEVICNNCGKVEKDIHNRYPLVCDYCSSEDIDVKSEYTASEIKKGKR